MDTGAKRGRDGGGEWGSPVSPEVLRCNLMNTLLENFIDDAIAYCLSLCDKIFDQFQLFD